MLFMRGSLYIYMCTMIGTFIFLENLKKCLDKMVKWRPFASLPEQFIGINEMLNDLNKLPKPIVSEDMREQIERGLIQSMQTHEEILISYYRDGLIHDMYINVQHIEPMLKTIYCTDAFGQNTEFKFDELVNIN